MRSMTALKFVCKQALKSNKAQLYFLISTGAHNFALKNYFCYLALTLKYLYFSNTGR